MSDRPQRRLAAIVAADVADFSRLVGRDEEGTLGALRACRRELIDPLIAEFGGRVANTAGDSLLLEFASVVDAVRCSIAIQQGLARRGGDVAEERRIRFRVGIHVGDVIAEGADLLGDGVNVAARLEALSEPGGIALSDDAYRQVRDRIALAWRDGGEQSVKNIVRPVHVWRWIADDAAREAKPALHRPPPPPADRPSIAVLPFNNLSNDPDQDYFSDGITEDIITEISRIPELMVISRNSTFTYKDKAAKVQDVCRDLGVLFVLEGSVRKARERVRIGAQLIDGRSGGHLWAERYDRGLDDIFAVQDDVAQKIARALEVKLIDGVAARQARRQTHNPEAYDLVLRGREQYRLFTRDGNDAARALYEQAIALDADYAEPYAGLAETFVQDWFMGSEPTLERAFALAEQASMRDQTLPLVQEALSTVYLFNRQPEQAIATARRWIELEPSNADAHATLAGAMHFAGENDEVIALINKAMRLNPFYPFYYPHYMGLAHLAMRRFDEAVTALRRAIARNPDALWPHVFLAACLGHMGNDAEASVQRAEVRRINPDFSVASLRKLLPYKNSADADLLLDGLKKAGLSI